MEDLICLLATVRTLKHQKTIISSLGVLKLDYKIWHLLGATAYYQQTIMSQIHFAIEIHIKKIWTLFFLRM